jgi:hypothetical protein
MQHPSIVQEATDMDQARDDLIERLRADEARRLGREIGQTTYRSTDPANRYVRCGCARTDCWTYDLLPLRSHVAALFRALVALGAEERFGGYSRHDDPWPGVIYALQLAGGIEDVSTDPSYVNDDDSSFYCEPVADREDEERELASKYTAAFIMFNFAWSAYEAAIEISAAGEFPKDKLPVRARKILAIEADEASKITELDASYKFARIICGRVASLKSELGLIETKYRLAGPPAAAELVRIFRNYIVHGGDTLPVDSVMPCYRLYAITRVVLLLVQFLVLRRVTQPAGSVLLSANLEELGREPAELVLRNLHYADRRWRTSRPGTERHGRTTRWFGGPA